MFVSVLCAVWIGGNLFLPVCSHPASPTALTLQVWRNMGMWRCPGWRNCKLVTSHPTRLPLCP